MLGFAPPACRRPPPFSRRSRALFACCLLEIGSGIWLSRLCIIASSNSPDWPFSFAQAAACCWPSKSFFPRSRPGPRVFYGSLASVLSVRHDHLNRQFVVSDVRRINMSGNKRSKASENENDEAFNKRSDRTRRDDDVERKIDLNLEGSFPASDPPAWTLGVEWRD